MKNNQHPDNKQGIFNILIFNYENKMKILDKGVVMECFVLFTL